MKKLILSAVAAVVAASPIAITAAEAAPIQRERTTVVRERPNGTVVTRTTTRRADARPNQYRKWRKGQRFDRRYAQNYRVIDYRTYRGRGLYAPPRGYRWVRSGNDAVLIAAASGLIGAVIGNAIR
jgi:Ni/Co efflux regulator RcnB